MKISFLGSGPTEAVGTRPGEKEKRINSSLLVSKDNFNLVIDITPYFEEQSKGIDHIDAILLSHAHADATGGLNQLKDYIKIHNAEKCNLYGIKETLDKVKEQFKTVEEYVSLIELLERQTIGPFNVAYIEINHSVQEGFPTISYKINSGGKVLVYSEDFCGFKDRKDEGFFKDNDCLIIDGALWKETTEKKLAENLSGEVEQSVGHLIIDIKDGESNYLKWLASLGNELNIITQRGRTWPEIDGANKTIQDIWKKHSNKKLLLAYDGLKVDFAKDIEKKIIFETPKIWTEEKKKQLLNDHRLLHVRYKNYLAGEEEYHRTEPLKGKKITRKWIVQNHEKLVRLMFKLDFKHNIVDELDRTLPKELKEKSEMKDNIRWCDDQELNQKLWEIKNELTTVNANALIPEKIAGEERPRFAKLLVKPHAELVWQKRKTMFISSVRFKKHLNENVFLCDKKYIYGIYRFSEPAEIKNKEEFDLLQDQHLVKWGEEALIWWKNKWPLWVYRIQEVERFDPPVFYHYPKGFEGFIKISKLKIPKKEVKKEMSECPSCHLHEFISGECITKAKRSLDFSKVIPGKLKSLTNQELAILHLKIHWEFENKDPAEASEKFVNAHYFVVQEFINRNMKHYMRDDLDRLTFKLKKIEASLDDIEELLIKGLKEEAIRELKNVEDLVIVDDYICWVGSGPNEQKPEDLDLLVRDVYIFPIVKLKILRRLKSIADKLHIFISPSGPNSNYISLWSLVLRKEPFKLTVINEDRYKEEKSLDIEESLEPLKSFIPAKTGKGYGKNEFFDIDALLTFWAAPEMFPIACEEKYDGLRISLHKKGEEIRINFEDAKTPREDKLPNLSKDLKSLNFEEVILDGELIDFDKDGNQIPRKDLIHFATGKDEQNDSGVKVMIFDVLWCDGEDLHEKPWRERQKYLIKALDINKGQLYRVIPIITHNKEELRKAIEEVSSRKMSEGAMCKSVLSIYPLTGSTSEWAKIKTIKEYDAIVLEVNQIKTGTYNYDVGILVSEKEKEKYSNIVEFEGKNYIKIGKTYNTVLKAQKGNIITVGVIEIKIIEENGKIKITHDNPIVRNLKPEKKEPDGVPTMERLARAGRGKLKKESDLQQISCKEIEIQHTGCEELENNILDLEEDNLYFENKLKEEGETRAGAAEKLWRENWWKVYPKDGSGKYVLQCHIRGLSEEESKKSFKELMNTNHSVHYDLRLTAEDGKYLWGITIFAGKMKEVKEASGNMLLIRKHLEGTPKNPQPLAWLHLPDAYVSKPGEVGATSNLYSKFFRITEGFYIAGTWRSHMMELIFTSGDLKDRRYVYAYAPLGGSRKWLLIHSEDKEWYAEKYDKEKIISELRKKHQRYLWWHEKGKKPELIEVK